MTPPSICVFQPLVTIVSRSAGPRNGAEIAGRLTGRHPHRRLCRKGMKTADEKSPAMDGAKIIVVDDEPELRELARRYLEIEGFRVEEAENGRVLMEMLPSVR